MTSRQAHRAYLDKTRRPRFSRAEERRLEREEQERIREEERAAKALERARAARERKRAREEEGRRERRMRGEPVVTVSASQGMISGFLRSGVGGGKGDGGGDENVRNGGGVSKAGGRGVDGNTRNAGAMSKGQGPGDRVVSENQRNARRGTADGPGGGVADNDGIGGSPVLRRLDEKVGKANKRNPGPPVPDIARDTSRGHPAGHADKLEPPRASGAAQDDGAELDDLFLSASQLAREVESMPPPPPRKRSRDEAFPAPDPAPPKPVNRTAAEPAADPDLEAYDLGISSQELLQLEVQELGPEKHSNPQSPQPEPRVELREPPEPPGDIGFSSTQQSFELCSQELLQIDALTAHIPLETKHPTTDTKADPERNEQSMAGTTSEGGVAKETEEPRRLATHADTNANPTANEQDTTEIPEDAEDAEEPQPFFTSSTQELISLAEKRSRATASAEALRRKRAAPLAGPRHDGETGSKAVGTAPGKNGGMPPPRAKRRETKGRSRSSGPAGVDLDDDAWWEDLDDTDLDALLAT